MTADTAALATNSDVDVATVGETDGGETFGGRWSESSVAHQAAELLNAVAATGPQADGSVRFARFDPPFKP